MIAVISILQASKIRGEREFAMNTNTINSKKAIPGVNDVATKCPMAAAMWSDKNAFTPSEEPAGSHKKAIFVCPDCGQEFESSICNVVNSLMHYRTGCPVCRGLKVVSGINDLATKCPAAANMWSSKNACSPNEVSAGNNKMAWFVCPDCKQEFKAPVCNVVNSLLHDNTGCPVCAGRKAVSGVNDLATMYPKAAAMWSGKNDYAPHDIPARSSRRAFFVCPDCKQEFVTSVRAMERAFGYGNNICPVCRGKHIVATAKENKAGFSKPIGTTLKMQDGNIATCVSYHGVNNIDVQFEDGFVLYHARWNQFVRGMLRHAVKTYTK